MAENGQRSEYIFHWAEDTDPTSVAALKAALGATVVDVSQSWGFELWQTEVAIDQDALASLTQDGAYGDIAVQLDYAETNLTVTATDFASDPRSNRLWGLHNTGQTGGLIDADIDLPEAWDISRGRGVVVAVLDTGVDYSHPDLAANMWVNTGEIAGNGRDDDGNGFVDDIYGYDFAYNDADPMDHQGHGTHVAGTIAAISGNGTGVVGVAPEAQIMALKFLDDTGSGSLFDAIQALEYAVMMGAQVSNNSWGSSRYSSALSNAIALAGAAGHTFVASAGNSGRNNEIDPHFPSSYDASNLISVAATNDEDRLAYFSNYGFTTVDVAAPGQSIHSTLPGGGYGTKSGTSMAAPHVTGIVALLLATDPDLTPEEIKDLLIATSDPIGALASRSASGGRVNAAAALSEVYSVEIAGRVVDTSGFGQSGWRVFLDADGDGHLDDTEVSTTTDANGGYRFTELDRTSYRVVAQIAPGFDLVGAVSDLSVNSFHTNTAYSTYRAIAPTSWVDVRSVAKELNFGDEGRLLVGLPFEFSFFGEAFDRLTITANGLLCFADAPYGTYANGLQTAPAASIAPFWTDLTSAFGGRVWVHSDAYAGTFTVQYDGLRGLDGTGHFRFQTVLHAEGDISFRYLEMSDPPDVVGIGLVSPDKTWFPVDQADALAGGGVRFTTKPITQSTIDVDAHGETSAPDVVVQAFGIDPSSTIQGTVWLDTDGDGLRDWGETGLSGRVVYLDTNSNGVWDSGEFQCTTDASGAYSFQNVAAGRYTVRQVDPTGWSATASGTADYVLSGTEVDGLARGTFEWRSVPASATRLSGLADDEAITVDLPYLFPFFGQGYGAVTVSANGYLTFYGDGFAYENQRLASSKLPGPIIAAFWDDLDANNATVDFWHDAGADELIFSFVNLQAYNGSGQFSFQVVLHESGDIKIHYRTIAGPAESATVGIADGSGEVLGVIHNEIGLTDGLSFHFAPLAAEDTSKDIVVGRDGTIGGVDLGSRPDAGFVPLPDSTGALSSSVFEAIYDSALLF